MLTAGFFGLLLDGLIAVLLSVTIAYCWVLNRRIKIMQDGKGELAILLKHFDESTKRASDSIVALQTTSKRIGEGIQFRIEKSNYMLEDLAYMIDKGEKLAGKLDASFAVSRARNRVMADDPVPRSPMRSVMKDISHEPTAVPFTQVMPEPASVNADTLTQNAGAHNDPADDTLQREKKLSSLEAMLEKVAQRSKLPTMEDAPAEQGRLIPETPPVQASEQKPDWYKMQRSTIVPPAPEKNIKNGGAGRQRSKAEQELLDMLKTGISG